MCSLIFFRRSCSSSAPRANALMKTFEFCFLPIYPRLGLVSSLPAFDNGYMFPALGTGYKLHFSRAWHWLQTFPRLALAFSRAWRRFHFTQTYPIRLYVSKLWIKVIQELLELTVVFNDLGFKRRGVCWYTMKINFNIRINNLERKT